MYRVAMVCEGPADREIIKSILDSYLDDYEVHPIQPPESAIGGDSGPFGGGWKGVRTWCVQEAAQDRIDSVMINADILIIQLDTDVAKDPEVDRTKPCPPARDTANQIHALIFEWLNLPKPSERIISCVPAMASETWALAALFPESSEITPSDQSPAEHTCIECRTDIKEILRKVGKRLRPKLVVSQDGELKNQSSGYKGQSGKICKAWMKVVSICAEAKRFHHDLIAVLPQISP